MRELIFAPSLRGARAAHLQHHPAPVLVLHQRARRSYLASAKFLERLRSTPLVWPVLSSRSEQPCTDAISHTRLIAAQSRTSFATKFHVSCFCRFLTYT